MGLPGGYGAASCTLKPCVRTYSSSIEAGYLKERLESRSPDIKWGSSRGEYQYGLLDTHCVSAEEGAFLTARGYELHSATRWIPFHGDPIHYNSPVDYEHYYSNDWSDNLERLLHGKCVYLIPGWFLWQIGYGDGNGPFTRNPAASQFVGTVQSLKRDRSVSGEQIHNVFDGPEVLQSIYNHGRVEFGWWFGCWEWKLASELAATAQRWYFRG